MKVVVYSNKSLDDIQSMVKEHFYFKKRKVLNSFTNKMKERLYNLSNENLFEENKHQIVYFNFTNNSNSIYMIFTISKNYQTNEITNLLLKNMLIINKEGSFLRKMEKYIITISSMPFVTEAKQDIVIIELFLTKEGLGNIEVIIKEFYSYLSSIRKIGINNDYWNKVINNNNKQFKYNLDSNVDPFTVSTILLDSLKEDYKNFLIGNNQMIYNESNIKSYFNDLTTKNMIVIIQSTNDTMLHNKNLFSSTQNKKNLKDFDTEYILSTISDTFIKKLDEVETNYTLPNIYDNYETTKKPEDIKPCYETEIKCEEDEYDNSTKYTPSQIKDSDNTYIINYKIDKSFHQIIHI